MKDLKITCDGCKSDITDTTNSVGYRLALNVEKLPIAKEAIYVTDMGIYPPLERDHHFCGMNCLMTWIKTPTPA